MVLSGEQNHSIDAADATLPCMWWMLLALVMAVVVLGTVLFGMRQRRLDLAYNIAKLHSEIGDYRVDLWDLQVRIIELSRPTMLKQAIEAQGLVLEPAAVSGEDSLHLMSVAQFNRGGPDHAGY